ncbi:MAG: cation:proton antiporter, partial [Nanoarchaeota archaeon]
METALLELGIIIGITLIITALMNLFKQPFIIGYIITGILVNYLGILKSSEAITIFGEIGILFLLFMVGIGLNPKVIKQTGKVAIITGLGQIIFTSIIGFIICIFLGYSVVTSLFISIALTLSSTIVIMKLLSDKGDLESLYGRISIGFLIIQDIIAMFVLMGISSFSSGFGIKEMLINTFAVGIGMVVILLMISHFFMPKIIEFIAKSQEFLLLFSLGWCMALSALFYYMNFSVEIGALLAGITLSLSPYRYEISSKTKNIRDFFIVLFFIWLGSQLVVSDIVTYFAIILYFSAFVLIGNPLIVMILMGILGYTKRTGFLAGLTVAQVSEFSLIIIAMGVKFGYLGKEILSIITMVTIITIAGSTYFIIYGDKIFKYLSNYLKIFERKGKKVDEYKYHDTKESYEIILFGYNRIGLSIANSFRKLKMRFLVVDYNPDTIFDMAKKGIHCRYGDA